MFSDYLKSTINKSSICELEYDFLCFSGEVNSGQLGDNLCRK